jgi:transcriptional regulator with AAA-type ATPase domain
MENNIERLIDVYLKTSFSILLLGERGIGKSRQLEKLKKVVKVNCASLVDDRFAETALFGYKKGAFTGANKDTEGYFHKADSGILFLDEFHCLKKETQEKLMLNLRTNERNDVCFYRFGSTDEDKVKFNLILASNRTINELKEILLPDFYDRVVQHVIEFPPLRNDRGRIEQHWKDIWEQLKFEEPAPKEKPLIDWLKKQEFWGNYRDLQKIAIYYHTYNLFDEKNKPAKDALEYTKNEFEKYGAKAPEQKIECFSFNRGKTEREIRKNFHFELQKWAIEEYGSKKKAAEALDVSERTLTDWKISQQQERNNKPHTRTQK